MAVKFSMNGQVDVPLDTLYAKMTDPKEQEEMAYKFGSSKAEGKITEEGDKLIVELYTEDPPKKGGDLEKATLTFTWDKNTKVCNWSRADLNNGDRVKVTGTSKLVADGDVTKTSDEGEINIDIPMIGKMIAKKIAAAMERKYPEKMKYWEDRINS